MLLLHSLIPMTRTLTVCDCGWNVCHSTHGTSPQDEVRNLCTSRPTQVQQTLWTLHALDPLYMLFQSALAMYSLLNMMKSVVASQNIFRGSPGVHTGTRWFSWGVASLPEGKSRCLGLVQLRRKYRLIRATSSPYH